LGEFCRVERRDRVVWVTIDRPGVRNALSPPASAELSLVWDDFEADDGLRVAVVTGAGAVFCAGFDLKWAREHPAPMLQARVGENGGFGGLTSRRLSKPVIAAVNGPAMGGGFELALACDLIVAADGARFGLPEIGLGIVANAGGVQRLVRQVPLKRALRVILANEPLSASEAFELGLVSLLVPGDQVLEAADDLAQRIAGMSPLAVAACLEIARVSVSMPLEDALAYQYPSVDRLFEALNRD
jgi:enoyl-CoA hydratase/carnithine racemase